MNYEYPEEFLELCELIYAVEPQIVWKLLFVYPHIEANWFYPSDNIDNSMYWSQTPEGHGYWDNLHDRVEALSNDD